MTRDNDMKSRKSLFQRRKSLNFRDAVASEANDNSQVPFNVLSDIMQTHINEVVDVTESSFSGLPKNN